MDIHTALQYRRAIDRNDYIEAQRIMDRAGANHHIKNRSFLHKLLTPLSTGLKKIRKGATRWR